MPFYSDVWQQILDGNTPDQQSHAGCGISSACILASFSTCPVYDRFDFAISFGGPSETIPPAITALLAETDDSIRILDHV